MGLNNSRENSRQGKAKKDEITGVACLRFTPLPIEIRFTSKHKPNQITNFP